MINLPFYVPYRIDLSNLKSLLLLSLLLFFMSNLKLNLILCHIHGSMNIKSFNTGPQIFCILQAFGADII